MAVDPNATPEIFRKLQNGFSPAVRSVAQTGTGVVGHRSAYLKAIDAHLSAVKGLASTGDGVSDESDQFSAELASVVDTFLRIQAEEEKWFGSFANLIVAVSKFGETEKDRLKELSTKHAKEEKYVIKEAKRSGDRSELSKWYDTELKGAKEQHAQRYAYFAKNYLELLRKQKDCARSCVDLAEHQLLDSDAADAVQRLDEVVKENTNDTIKSRPEELNGQVESGHKRQESVHSEVKSKTKSTNTPASVKKEIIHPAKMVASVQTTEDIIRPPSQPNTVASRVSSRSGLGRYDSDTNSYEPPVALPRGKILSPNIYRPTPILAHLQRSMHYEENNNRLEQENQPIVPHEPAKDEFYWHKNNYQQPIDAYAPAPRPKKDIYNPNIPNPDYDRKPEEIPKPIKPEEPPAKPIFSAAEYGRTLECIQAHEAQGDHQLSLQVGDRLKLVKSGTRGWVLGRTTDSRQGWFPAKFLRMI